MFSLSEVCQSVGMHKKCSKTPRILGESLDCGQLFKPCFISHPYLFRILSAAGKMWFSLLYAAYIAHVNNMNFCLEMYLFPERMS